MARATTPTSAPWGRLALLTAAGRLGLGALLTLATSWSWRRLTGQAPDATTRLAVRMMGVRDLGLGAGALLAQRRGAPVRGWLEAAAVADGADAALLAGSSALPRSRRLLGLVVPTTAAAVSALGARALPR